MVVIMTTLLAIFFFGVDSVLLRDRPGSCSASWPEPSGSNEKHSMSRWYIIHAYSGFENKVRDAIMAEAKRLGLDRRVEAVEVPTETVTEVKRGKKVQVERKFMPGYVLAKLTMNDDVYHLVKNTPKVTGFLGPSGKPQPITDARGRAHPRTRKEEAAGRAQAEDQRRLRDRRQVKVLDGPFASFNGLVEELDFDRSRVKVASRSSAARRRSSSSSSRSNWSSNSALSSLSASAW